LATCAPPSFSPFTLLVALPTSRRRMRQYLIFRLLISVLGFVLIAFHIAWLAPGSSYSAVAFLYTALTAYFFAAVAFQVTFRRWQDRKSTRLNSSHVKISYAVFC